MIKLVAMDFDLTMFDYRKPADTRVLGTWFDTLTREGVMVGTASGRTLESLRHELGAIGMGWGVPFPSFAIVEEGVVLGGDGAAWPGLETRNKERGARIHAGNMKLMPLFEMGMEWALREKIHIERRIEAGTHGINMAFNTPENAERVRRRMIEDLGGFGGEDFKLVRNHHIVIGLPEGCDKGAAVSDLANALKVPAQETLVIGDNLNDLCMFDVMHGFEVATVGNGVAEAREAVLARGGYVAKGEIAFGVVEIFEKVFGGMWEEEGEFSTGMKRHF